MLPRQQEQDPSKIDVDVMIKERPMQTAEIEAEWSIAPNDSGKPTIVSLVPGSPPVLLCCCSRSSRQLLVTRQLELCCPVFGGTPDTHFTMSGWHCLRQPSEPTLGIPQH